MNGYGAGERTGGAKGQNGLKTGRKSSIGTLAALILVCVFGAAMLLSLMTGAGVYRQVQQRASDGAAERIGLSYVSAKLHASDEAGAIDIGSFDGLDAVYLFEEQDGIEYETILYAYDGWLRELYCERGYELGPEAGETIAEASAFTVSEPEPGLLRIEISPAEGSSEKPQSADVYIRSGN